MVRLLMVAALLVTLPRPATGQFGNAPAPGATGKQESRTQKWEFGVSIRAMGGPCAGLVGTFPLPADWPEQQVKVVGETITPHVRRHSIRESEGLKQVLFEVPQLAVGETATCFITLEIVKTAQAIKTLSSGALVEVLATDPGSVKDFAAWARSTGNDIVEQSADGGVFRFILRRK